MGKMCPHMVNVVLTMCAQAQRPYRVPALLPLATSLERWNFWRIFQSGQDLLYANARLVKRPPGIPRTNRPGDQHRASAARAAHRGGGHRRA
jgi:hypothetical protein